MDYTKRLRYFSLVIKLLTKRCELTKLSTYMSNIQVSINPYNNKQNIVINTQSVEDIEQILKNTQDAVPTWSNISVAERIEYMVKFKNAIEELQDELARIISIEIGCPVSQSIQEVTKCKSILDYFIEHGAQYIEDEIIVNDDKVLKKIIYDPIGTLLHIAPYNYPLYLALRPIIPSLLIGNRNIIKTSSQTPLIGQAIEKLALKAGLPNGVLQVIYVRGSDTEWIIEDKRVHMVCLIGSEKSGSIVAAAAGKYLKKTILELGGNDPMIVCADADLDKVIEGVMASRLRNAGQSCNAAKRFIVHKLVIEKFNNKLVDQLKKLVTGDPTNVKTTIGPVANKDSLMTIQLQIKNSVAKGAKVIYGGEIKENLGCFMTPCVMTGVNESMPVFYEEVFGPVLPVIEFDTVEEAIRLANDSIYGLGASVWTKDQSIINQMYQELETGNIAVNSIVRGDPLLPFGGIKKSGYGREFAKAGLHEMANIKSISVIK
jgi:succinate-semialdehyde dehydrogenase / glutarate-semialdehyde dehydrogenase